MEQQATKSKSRFVRFGIDEFKAALSYINGPNKEVTKSGVWEYIFDVPILKVPGLVVRIYSSVDKITGFSRDKGSDAIRLMLVRSDNDMSLSETEKILRTFGWSGRLSEKAKELISYALNLICPKCKTLLVHKTGKHGKFLGCPNYPACTHTHSLPQ